MANSLMVIISDGSLSTIPLTIQFFEQAHINVSVNDTPLPSGGYTYAWTGASTIQITPAVASGAKVVIQRKTPAAAILHDFQAGAVFSEVSVDENFRQELFLLQEASEQSLVTDLFDDLDMHGSRVRNMADAILPQDAVTLSQAEDLASSGGTSTLRGELVAPSGATLLGTPSGTVQAVLDGLSADIDNVAASVSTLDDATTTTFLSEAGAIQAGIRNRASYKFLSCPPTTNALGELLTMQTFFMDVLNNRVWLGYDNSDRSRQVLEQRKLNGEVVSSDVYTGANTVGHLDGFHINSDGSAYCTDKFTNPSVLKISGGVILERYTYNIPTNGNQILAVDRSFPDRLLILTKDTGDVIRIYQSTFSGMVAGVLQLVDTGIAVPQTETIQGLAVLYDRVYLLTGDGGLFTNKFLYEFRTVDGALIAKLPHNPDRLYADTNFGANGREPEGLNVVFEPGHNEQVVQIYSGVLFANFSMGIAHNIIYKHAHTGARSMTPGYNAWVGRADGAEQARAVAHPILFRKTAGVWDVWRGAFDSALSRQLVSRVVAGGPSNKGLVFDLTASYQSIIGVSITCNSGLPQTSGCDVYWVESTGGSTSRLNQKINFLRRSDNVYLDADDATIPNGAWIALTLTVIM